MWSRTDIFICPFNMLLFRYRLLCHLASQPQNCSRYPSLVKSELLSLKACRAAVSCGTAVRSVCLVFRWFPERPQSKSSNTRNGTVASRQRCSSYPPDTTNNCSCLVIHSARNSRQQPRRRLWFGSRWAFVFFHFIHDFCGSLTLFFDKEVALVLITGKADKIDTKGKSYGIITNLFHGWTFVRTRQHSGGCFVFLRTSTSLKWYAVRNDNTKLCKSRHNYKPSYHYSFSAMFGNH